MYNCGGVLFVAVVLFGFLALFVAMDVEAGHEVEFDPAHLKYYGGHTPGPSEYGEEKFGELDVVGFG